jgi:hypothetical protein
VEIPEVAEVRAPVKLVSPLQHEAFGIGVGIEQLVDEARELL